MKSCWSRYSRPALSLAACLLVAACGGISSPRDSRGSGGAGANGAGGTGGMGSSGKANGATDQFCGPNDNVTLLPTPTGWVDGQEECNSIGVQGHWYPFGDQYTTGYGAAKCLTYGMHDPSECFLITSPDPTQMVFPNVNGAMHITGSVEKVLGCVANSLASTIPTAGCVGGGMPGGLDYANMWGGGIAFDFNADSPEPGATRHTWNPSAHGVIGVEFTLTNAPAGLRVEFPMELTAAEAASDTPPITALPPTTDEHTAGPPYWGAKPNGVFPNSPVAEGDNVITWDKVSAPKSNVYAFDLSRILGIYFHVPTNAASTDAFDFTISNFTFLRHL